MIADSTRFRSGDINRCTPLRSPISDIRSLYERSTDRGVAIAGTRVSALAKRRFWITASPEAATYL